MSVRLPVLDGSAARGDGTQDRAVVGAAEGLAPTPRPTVCVLAAAPTVGGATVLARAVASELCAAGLRVGALPDGAPAPSLAEAYAPFADADVVVARGADLLAVASPTLTVMVTAGLLPPAWSREARSLRGRVDVTLGDARDAFARALAAGWPRAHGR